MEFLLIACAFLVVFALGALFGAVCALLALHKAGRLVGFRGHTERPGAKIVPPRGGSGLAPPKAPTPQPPYKV